MVSGDHPSLDELRYQAPNDLTQYHDDRGDNQMQGDLAEGLDRPAPGDEVGQHREKHGAPHHANPARDTKREHERDEHKGARRDQTSEVVANRGAHGAAAPDLALLVDVDAERVRQVVRNRDDQQASNDGGPAQVRRAEPHD